MKTFVNIVFIVLVLMTVDAGATVVSNSAPSINDNIYLALMSGQIILLLGVIGFANRYIEKIFWTQIQTPEFKDALTKFTQDSIREPDSELSSHRKDIYAHEAMRRAFLEEIDERVKDTVERTLQKSLSEFQVQIVSPMLQHQAAMLKIIETKENRRRTTNGVEDNG